MASSFGFCCKARIITSHHQHSNKMFVGSLLLLLGAVCWTDSFLLQPQQVRHPFTRSLSRSPLFSSSNDNDSDASVSEIQQRLVGYGVSWKQAQITPNMTRVPGCVATVHVLASIENDNKVLVQGHSDAIVVVH
jgi:hypothetical protein